MTSEVLIVENQELLLTESVSLEVVEVLGTTELLEVALQGPPGPAGPGGDEGINATAGEALGGHRAVVLDAVSSAWYASNTNMQHLGRVAGITLGAVISGDSATILRSGYVTEPSWSWTPNAPIYLSTSGQLTQTPPVTGFLQGVGIALSTTSAFINLREPIVIT